jgi:hypothetical protein
MDYQTALALAQRMRDNWNNWNDLQRGEAIVLFRNAGESHRKLAKIVGCSEGLIRHIEIVGRLPLGWKQLILNGHSTRRVVAAWRALRKRGQ